MPGQGISSTGKLMENYGLLKGILIANVIPFKEITPGTWMKYLPFKKDKLSGKSQWKTKLSQLAKQLYPKYATRNSADAILMIHYFEQIY
jgi:hypothetical protein